MIFWKKYLDKNFELKYQLKKLFNRSPRNIKELSIALEKQYWDSKQYLNVSTIEMLHYKGSQGNGPFSVYSMDLKNNDWKYFLFDIQNYGSFYEDVFPIEKSILYPKKFDYKTKWDSLSASTSIFYNARERVYTLPKFTRITEDDILRCTKHFIRNILDKCLFFNIRWCEYKGDKWVQTKKYC